MKKNTFKGMLISGVLFASTGLYAQSPAQREQIAKHSDVVRLKELALRFNEKYQTGHAEALKLAAQNNWPVEFDKDGGHISLIRMSSYGFPIYYGTSNVGSAITSRTNTLQVGGSLGLNLTGVDISLGVWDGQYPLITHVDIAGRAIANDGTGSPIALHPTHVLGTILGSGAGDPAAKGMATQASATVNNYDNDLSEMTNQATSIVVSNHSYGLIATNLPSWFFGTYSDDSKDLDELLFSAPYYQPVFAAGNDNGGSGSYDLLTANSNSKNAIVVAAVDEVDNYTDASSVHIASFSNWGPTDDNRIKPDISSKGTNVYSTSNASTTSYAVLDGTSMATPGITGAIALLQQHYLNLHLDQEVPFMKSATVRGLVAHCADEAGTNDGPDAKFGWGLMNSEKIAQAITHAHDGTTASISELTLLPGETYTLNVQALGTEPLIATLAWTDPAGEVTTGGTAAVLVNDLDIRVKQGTQTTYPWKLGTSLTAAATRGDNTKDNIEKAELINPSGNYTITISHKGSTLVNPGTDASPSQDYSLIITGINAGVSATENVVSTMFNVYPNPATSQIIISLNNGFEQAQATIIDVQGRNVMNFAINTATTVLDINSLNSGVYFVKIASGNHTEVKKVIVN